MKTIAGCAAGKNQRAYKNQMTNKSAFAIASILPLWRWAVCPTANHSPGIPFYREKEAREFFNKACRELPWAGCFLLRRRWKWFHSEVEVMQEYEGRGDILSHFQP